MLSQTASVWGQVDTQGMQGGDETDPVCFGARHLSQHRLATRGPSIPALQRVIHTTFVKIDKVLGI
jgi:hypothetical protein